MAICTFRGRPGSAVAAAQLAMFVALALLVATTPTVADNSSSPRAETHATAEEVPHFALLVDIGVPQGVGASLGWRPWSWFRVHGGPATNGISLGWRGGLSLVPFGGVFRPILTFGAGRFAEGDARRLLRAFAPDLQQVERALPSVGYEFTLAHVGFELGSPSAVSFFLCGGVSRTALRVAGLPEVLWSALDAVSRPGSTTLTIVSPSVQLGLLLYLL
jgi:hypothetical protein